MILLIYNISMEGDVGFGPTTFGFGGHDLSFTSVYLTLPKPINNRAYSKITFPSPYPLLP